ncbi:MAG: ankyrin repeat domain-containing protein [Candidatus Omnitrophica bacterium]|nr:ankyrin repeat domain-containing protein [Candidatus Omnitrophota bacterium]
MHWALAESVDETAELRDYVKRGCLFAVQDWISAQKPLYCKKSGRRHFLSIAVENGFHSMVQVLASVWPDQESLNAALNQAAENRRVDLVWLLLEHGVDLNSVELFSIAECNDKELLRFFFDRWDEVGDEDGLTEVVLAMPRPLVGLIREYAPRLPNSQLQLAKAMKTFIREDHPKWIGLTLWMGGNPRLPAPDAFFRSDDPADWTSALQDAVSSCHLAALKLFKPSKERDDLNELLTHVSFFNLERAEAAEYLLKRGAQINNKPNGGSSILDSLFRSADFRLSLEKSRWYYSSEIAQIKRWISRGARWEPDDKYDYRSVRKTLQGLQVNDAWTLIENLSETTAEALLLDLCNTPKIRQLFEVTPKELKHKIEGINLRRQKSEERQRLFPRKPSQTKFKQRRAGILGIKETRITRGELYENVWSKPMKEIASDYRITMERLVKICVDHNVPRPNTGHWQKVSSGKTVRRKPLLDPENDPQIQIRAHEGLPDIPFPSVREHAARLIEQMTQPGLEIKVPRKSKKIHALMTKIGERDDQSPNSQGNVASRGEPKPECQRAGLDVSKDLQNRAERVLNALFFFLEEYGLSVSLTEGRGRTIHAGASMLNGHAEFTICEEHRRLRLILYRCPRRDRMTWGDGDRVLIEECFSDFAAHLVYTIALNCKSDEKEH